MAIARPTAGFLMLVLALLAARSDAIAQTAPETKIEKARELFLVTSGSAIGQGIYQHCLMMVAMRFAQASPAVPSEEIHSTLKEELDKALDQNMPVLADQVAVVYAETFTEEELDEVLTNSVGPAVQSYQAKFPTIAEETTSLIAAWSQPLVLGVAESTEERLREKGLVQ